MGGVLVNDGAEKGQESSRPTNVMDEDGRQSRRPAKTHRWDLAAAAGSVLGVAPSRARRATCGRWSVQTCVRTLSSLEIRLGQLVRGVGSAKMNGKRSMAARTSATGGDLDRIVTTGDCSLLRGCPGP